MKSKRRSAIAAAAAACLLMSAAPAAGETPLATIKIREPLGQRWTDEWLTAEVLVDSGTRGVRIDRLRLLDASGATVPAQYYANDRLLDGGETVSQPVRLRVLFLATVEANQTLALRLVDDPAVDPAPALAIRHAGGRSIVANDFYEVELDPRQPLPINAMRSGSAAGSLGTFAWPEGVVAIGVEDRWIEQGPARAIVERTFRFAAPEHHYRLTLDFRAADPWIAVVDEYALGEGSAITLDLRGLKPDRVYHEYAYNARTFRPGGDPEDTTLQPPQHSIATLGPIWRDIWYNGGPFAFIYRRDADHGVGLAAVRGSRWEAPTGVSLESQNLYVDGDREREGQVRVRIPCDAGTRHWAIVLGHPDLRQQMPRMIRRRADIPLETVLREWVLEWPSDAPAVRHGAAGTYLGSHFNRHFFNPTTYPRRVKRALPEAGPVQSRDLAVLAYVFSNPDYWPGPSYRWRIGNPNFHTDMYPIPFRIGLLMPDHPHAARWVEHGIENLHWQIHNDSFPGGSWAESPDYSAYFFHITEYLGMAVEAGQVNAFAQWPRVREVAEWFACIQTPVDPRYGARQTVPLGDTSPGNHIKELNRLGEHYAGIDDRFAEQLRRFDRNWDDALDISSREFYGFGATLRGNAYDARHESFVALKAGPARNHYQGDELSFFFSSLGTPLAIAYACHYSPRPWHAAMHNRPDMNDKRPVAVAVRRAFRVSEAADVFVADERTRRISHVPLEPHRTDKPGWEYPTTLLDEAAPWTMRRYAMLVKHAPHREGIPDYLILRDEIVSPEPVWWNLHVLARDIERDGGRFIFRGQLGVDLTAHFLAPTVDRTMEREWGWRGRDGNRLRNLKGREYERKMFGAYVPEDFERGTWGRSDEQHGEMAQWLRVHGAAGRTDWLVALLPHRRGSKPARVEPLSPTSARITLGRRSEIVHLGSDGPYQAAVERDGQLTVLLGPGEVRPWEELDFQPAPAPGEPDS